MFFSMGILGSKHGNMVPSGKQTYGTWPFLMGKLTISMAMFNSYVKLREGSCSYFLIGCFVLLSGCSTGKPA